MSSAGGTAHTAAERIVAIVPEPPHRVLVDEGCRVAEVVEAGDLARVHARRVPGLADQRCVFVRVRQHLEQQLLLELEQLRSRHRLVLGVEVRAVDRRQVHERSPRAGRQKRNTWARASCACYRSAAQLLLDELPCHRVHRPGVARGIRARELAESVLERRHRAGDDGRELVGKVDLRPRPFGREHLGAAGASLVETEREHLVDPRLECSARRAGLRELRGEVRVTSLRFVLVHREHELVLGAEVPVERARRETGFGEDVGDGEAGGAALAQHAETGLDQRADFVLGAALPGRHRSRDHSLRNRHAHA